MGSRKCKMNNLCLEETRDHGRLWEMPQYAGWSLAFHLGGFQSWLCIPDSSQGKLFGARLKFVLLATNIYSRDITAAGLTSLVLGKWRLLESILHLLHFPNEETEEVFGTRAVSCLCHPSLCQLKSWCS